MKKYKIIRLIKTPKSMFFLKGKNFIFIVLVVICFGLIELLLQKLKKLGKNYVNVVQEKDKKK